MLRYRKGEPYRLKRRSRHIRPEPAVLDSLAAAGILQRRGRRAGRNTQRPITVVDSTLTGARYGHRRRGARIHTRGSNVNNLIRPRLMRHAFRPVSKIVCATLNVRSLRNMVDAVDDLVRSGGLDVLKVTESWHEGSSCVCIARLRGLGCSVVEEARPISPEADLDSVDYRKPGLLCTCRVTLHTWGT